MSVKCQNCGASLMDDSKFCKYCGAKIEDNSRFEIHLDQRIEDVAEIKRVEYEEKESKLRQKKARQEIRAVSARRTILLTLLILCAVIGIPGCIINPTGAWATICAFSLFGFGIFGVTILVLLIRGRW